MNVILLLIAIAVAVALTFLGLFAWAVRNGQYNDMDGPPRRILFDDPPIGKDKAA